MPGGDLNPIRHLRERRGAEDTETTQTAAGRRAEIGIVYLTGLAQGLALVTFPAAGTIFTNPAFHGLTNREYGTLFLPMIVCAILASSLGGTRAPRWGLKRVLVLGLSFNTASMAILALSHAFVATHEVAYGFLLTAMAALGAGFGAALTALNTYAARFFPAKADTALTALHAMLGIGTALAPLLLGVFVSVGRWWGDPLTIGGLFLALGVASLVRPLEGPSTADRPPLGGPLALLRGLPQPLYGYGAIAVLYGLCETILGNWATIYLHEGKGLSPQAAGFSLATFWAMVTAGRVLVAALSARYSPHRIYLAMPILILGAFLVIPIVEGRTGNVVAFGAAGLACSAFLPLSISFATREFSEMAEVVSGGMMAAFMVGYGLGAYGVGPMLEITGLTLSAIYTGASTVAAGMAILAFLLTKPRLARAFSIIILLATAVAISGCVGRHEIPRVATVAVGQWPENVAFDPGSGRVFVADEGSATVTVLQTDGQRVGTISLKTRARHLAVDPGLRYLYAPNEGSATVAAFDTLSLVEAFRVAVGREPHGIAVDLVSHRVFVGNEGDGSLTAFDGSTGGILYTVPVGPGPGGVTADPVTGRVFVVSVKADRVIALEGATGKRLAEIGVERGPTHLGINSATGVVYVVNTEEGSVTLVDGRTLHPLTTLRIGNYPLAVAIDENAGRAYVVNNRENTLSIVREAAREVLGTRRIPRNVSSVALNPEQGLLYLALKDDDQVAVVRVRDL